MGPAHRRDAAALMAGVVAGWLGLTGAAQARDPFAYVTPWFRTEQLEPVFEIPHLLRLGPAERAEVLRDGAWREGYRGERGEPKALEGGRAVLLRAAAEIHREGTAEVTRLPAEACGPWWPGHVAVPAGLERIVCVRASAERGCGRVMVTQFDTAGHLLRRDEVGPATVCAQVKANDDYSSHGLGGLTATGDPVVAVQVGVEAGKLPR